MKHEATKAYTKKSRFGNCEPEERRSPKYLSDYVVNVVQPTAHIVDEDGKSFKGSDVKVPRNRRERLQSPWKNFFMTAEATEMAALKEKEVLEEIIIEEVSQDAHTVTTMWVYAIKSDQQDYVIRFKARIVALGNYQRPNIDFKYAFAPVARMSSF